MDKIDSQGMPDDTINIGDVMEVIETDPDYTNNKGKMKKMGSYNCLETTRTTPRCIIVEEPAQKQLRFRYECEGRSAGSIPGANSTPDNKTYPTIKVEGYKGKAVVVVSCVTKDEPFRPHPHKLVGREGCKQGVCTVPIPEDTMTVSFQNLGVQCVKKKEIEDALKAREDIRVDPFMTGFSHRSSPTSIDLNAVRLCFQVFLHTQNKGKYTNLPPIVSNPIYDKKAMSDLLIVKLSDCVCPVDGGSKDIILLCEKVAKEDIQVRFFEEQNGRVVWEGFGEFQPAQVHKQTAIWFRPPRYRTLEVIDPVKMFVQLRRPSDGATSAPVPFQMVSLGKRRAESSDQPPNKKIFTELHNRVKNSPLPEMDFTQQLNIPLQTTVKDEPRDLLRSPYQYMDQLSRSPQHYPQTCYIQQQPMPSTSSINHQIVQPLESIHYNLSPPAYNPMEVIPSDPQRNVQYIRNELNPITIEPGDLGLNEIAQNLSSSLSLTDFGADGMTDSLDRLANNEFDRHLALNQVNNQH
ncbi:embryonic polarity protein dorsal-like isoform X4 [Onthophagus taurus]|uniref:embryonic polarity protein dorsal-like isoform X4 n=1 Tax=Onthophagus taurus TaxID=166361 RepID=UPI0039BDCA11